MKVTSAKALLANRKAKKNCISKRKEEKWYKNEKT